MLNLNDLLYKAIILLSVTFLFKCHKFLVLFDTHYKYLIDQKIVQNNRGIFLVFILKRSVHKIRRF